MLEGARKDRQTALPDGSTLRQLIDGVRTKEVPNIVTGNGITTEFYRPEWPIGPDQVRHMIHVILRPEAVSAWHVHEHQTDTFFVSQGTLRLVLFDDREESPTRGMCNALNLSRMRPTLVTVPPLIWHGIQNLDRTESSFVNYFDRPYDYADPDEWRLPIHTDKIPYRF